MKYRVELTWPQVEALREAAAFRLAGEFDGTFDHRTLGRAAARLADVHYRPTRAQRNAAIGATTGGFR